ncbi:MAG: peptidylprolyl isomerase [bacterium]|nr:peptidylprolyl isomerase [bacterium]
MKYTKMSWFLWITIVFLISIAGTGCKKESIVATVGEEKITAEDLKIELIRRTRSEEAAAKLPLEHRLETLDNMIDLKLKLLDAAAKKITERPELKVMFQEKLLLAASQEMYDREVRDKVISEREAKKFWKMMNKEVKASHILVSVNKDAKPEEINRAKVRIDSIYQVVTKPNVDFNAIAAQTTQDMSARNGDIGYFRWGQMVDEFQEKAWKMKVGEISKPFLTEYGWHIVKVTDIRPLERFPYKKMRDEIYRRLMGIHRDEMIKRANQFLEKLRNRYQVQLKKDNLQLIFSKLGPSSLVDNDPFATLTDAEKQIPLFTFKPGKNKFDNVVEKEYYKKGHITAQTLIDEFAKNRRPGPISDTAALRSMAENILTKWLIFDFVLEKKLDQKPSVRRKAEEDLQMQILSRLEQEEILDRTNNPTDQQLKEFMQRDPKRWYTTPTTDIMEVLFHTREEAETFLSQAKKKGKITQQDAKKLSKRIYPTGKEGILENITSSMYGAIGAAAANAKVGEIVGPVVEGTNYSVFQVTRKSEPVPLTIEKDRQKILEYYRREVGDELRRAWMERLRKQYPVIVYEKEVRKIFGGIKTPEQPKGAPAKGSRLSEPKRVDQEHRDH